MKAAFRIPLAQVAAATMAAIFTVAPLSADEPAENAAPGNPEQVANEVELLLQSAYDVQYAWLATSADAFIGIEVSSPDDVLRSHLGLAEGRGLVVTSVAEGGPAARAGIQVNDVLIAVGDEEIDGGEKLRQLLEASQEKPVSVAFVRGGRRQTVELTPHAGAIAQGLRYLTHEALAAEAPKFWLGVGLANADDALRSHLGIAAGEGLIVTGIENDSPAAKAGLMTNDLLLKLDRKPLKSIEELSAQLQEIENKSVALELLRRGKPATLTVTPELRRQPAVAAQYASNYDGQVRSIISFALAQPATVWDRATVRLEHADLASAEEQADLIAKVNELVAHAKQLQSSLEALQATLNAPGQPPAGDK
jgi:membrane-associated protease RseP (regulator of RpoE activity)